MGVSGDAKPVVFTGSLNALLQGCEMPAEPPKSVCDNCHSHHDAMIRARAALGECAARLRILERVLGFYANQDSYAAPSLGGADIADVVEDGGARARAGLTR